MQTRSFCSSVNTGGVFFTCIHPENLAEGLGLAWSLTIGSPRGPQTHLSFDRRSPGTAHINVYWPASICGLQGSRSRGGSYITLERDNRPAASVLAQKSDGREGAT